MSRVERQMAFAVAVVEMAVATAAVIRDVTVSQGTYSANETAARRIGGMSPGTRDV